MESILQDRTVLMVIAGILGAVFGSFATALIYRLPREMNWWSKRSACPKCHHALGLMDLFPLFSYLFTQGKCRYCKAGFGANYLITEFAMVIGFVAAAFFFGPTFKTVAICSLVFCTLVIWEVDFEFYIIPDEINILLFITGIAYGISNNEGIEQLVYMPLFFFALAISLRWMMFVWKKKEGLGLGDVKFFIAAGTFLPVGSLPLFLFMSGIVGILIAILWRIRKKGEIFPFGPALAVSLLFCVAFPESYGKLMLLIQESVN